VIDRIDPPRLPRLKRDPHAEQEPGDARWTNAGGFPSDSVLRRGVS
jgi:hypothetical protein